jgi:predicted ATP-grasp superfamily ATP-dependent carboligase
LELNECPPLRQPVLLAAFAGWGDGALAGTGALQYLVGKYDAPMLGTFDSDDIYDYTSTRPVTVLREGGERELVWPALQLRACPLPQSERDALFLVGPEPDLRWRACAAAIVDAAVQCGATAVIALGSYWDRVPHVGRPLFTARAADARMREALKELNLQESGYQGPTGFTSALLDACSGKELPAGSLAGRAPHYLQGMAHPKLAWGLLELVHRLTAVDFSRSELEEAAGEQERLLTDRLQQEPKLWHHVQRLVAEQGIDASLGVSTLDSWRPGGEMLRDAQPAELPSPSEVVDAVEAFFRRSGQTD